MSGRYRKEYFAWGEWHTLSEWSRITKIPRVTLYNRLSKLPEDGEFEDILIPSKGPKIYEINGERHTLSEWAMITGMPWDRLHTRVNRLKPGESYEKLIAEPQRAPLYEAFGEKHTLPEWCRILKISKGTLQYRVRNQDSSFEEILEQFMDRESIKTLLFLRKFVPPVSQAAVKAKYENNPELKFRWQCFANYLRKNPFCREYLRKRQNDMCPICNEPLGEGTVWMHFLDYDCLCTFAYSTKDLVSFPYPSKRDPNRREKAPNCELCMIRNKEQFNNCMSKYILVHGPCNELIYTNTR